MSKRKSEKSKKSARKKAKRESGVPDGGRLVVDNRKARHKFTILETLECGIELRGSEVKSLREGRVSLDEAYGRVEDGEVWLVGCDIPPYVQATHFNHESKRPRKLLMHRREIRRFAAPAREKGLALVPLKLYFNQRGVAKVLMGLCRGKQTHDKRESLKKKDLERGLQRAYRARTERDGSS